MDSRALPLELKPSYVMAGHGRSKNGVASLAYLPAIPISEALCLPKRDARVKPAHDRVLIQSDREALYFPQFHTAPIGVWVQHGPKPPPFHWPR